MDNVPKKIHYCWFGGKEKPKIVIKCIDSWKTYLKDYEIADIRCLQIFIENMEE